MSERCAQLDRFADGELVPSEADAFRDHLGLCDGCAARLHDRAMLAALEEDLDAPPRSAKRPAQVAVGPGLRWRRRTSFSIAAIAIAASVALVASKGEWARRGATGPATIALLEGATRPIEPRLSYGPADGYRPYEVERGGSKTSTSVPLDALARLEREGEYRGVAAGMLLSGEPARAQAYLARAAASPEVEIDRAAVAIVRHEDEEARDLLDGALAKSPHQPQALWNQALAMRDLHLPFAAAARWDEVAALGEPGWSDEAKQRAGALRAANDDRAARWTRARAAFDAMGKGGPVPADEIVRAYPSYARLSLYDAVRTTASRERIVALVPLAIALEGGNARGPLVRYVRGLADGDLARRAAFVPEVAYLLGGALSPEDLARLVAKLTAAGEDDLALEAVSLAHAFDRFPAAAHRVAAAHDDPWLTILDARARAYAAQSAGDFAAAERTLRDAIAAGEANRFDYLAAATELQLADMLIENYRGEEASAVVASGLKRSEVQAPGVWAALAGDAAELAEARGAFPLMRAYFRDLLLRKPGCAARRHAHEAMAKERLLAMDFDGAERELADDDMCGEPMTLDRGLAKTILARSAPEGRSLSEVEALRTDLAAARASQGPGEQAFADVLEGVAMLRGDHAAGEALLRRGIGAAAQRRDDGIAQSAAAWGRLNLALAAARAEDASSALGYLIDDAGGADDRRCALAVGLDYDLAFAAAADREGAALSSFDDRVDAAVVSPERLVPARIRAHLGGCPVVHVFAPPPVHGTADLLPPDTAWTFHASGRRAPIAADAGERRLLVTNVEPPKALGLPELQGWAGDGTAGTAGVWLHGSSATPGRVLDELARTNEAEIHVHGLTDPGVSDAPLLALSPDEGGHYALTARAVEAAHFGLHPVVVLAACRAGGVAPYFHEPWSLPAALLHAGARVVLAATSAIPDADASLFFDAVLARIRAGAEPAIALRDERVAWLHRDARQHDWVRSVLIFD